MRRVTGIGGIFFKAADPEKLEAWYEQHLGLMRDPGGAGITFQWREPQSDKTGMTVWHAFPNDTDYFEPSRSPYMINYRVENLDALIEMLRAEGVAVDKREDYEYGRFAWITDPEGNRIELWEPTA